MRPALESPVAELIVLDLDGGNMLKACLASIDSQVVAPARVIVFDNGSAVSVADRVGGEYRFDLVVERSETNIGFTGGINRAMERVWGAYVGWINNDALLDPEWLKVLSDALDRDPNLGAVQARIRRDDHLLDGAGIEIESGRFVQAGYRAPIESYIPFRPAWGVSATAALYRVAALRDVALGPDILHPEFFAWYEDVELCARLHDGGWGTEVVRQVLATHAGSQSSVKIGERAIVLRTRNRYWTARLHPGVGRVGALLREDVRLLARAILRGRFAHVGLLIRGVFAGLAARIP